MHICEMKYSSSRSTLGRLLAPRTIAVVAEIQMRKKFLSGLVCAVWYSTGTGMIAESWYNTMLRTFVGSIPSRISPMLHYCQSDQ